MLGRSSGAIGSPSSMTPSKGVAAVEENDPSMTVLNMNGNVSFVMKHREYCERLGSAIAKNTHLKELRLSNCEIDSVSAKFLAQGLAVNKSIRVVDLSKNKISNEGSSEIAEALKKNATINELNLLGQPHAFGESCLEVWLNMLTDYNISLRKIIWRLDSRKSFPINKLIVRNNTIRKFLDDGKSLEEGQKEGKFKIPDTANCDPQSLKD